MAECVKDINDYLQSVKNLIKCGKYRISNREVNNDLFYDYVINVEGAKQILLKLEASDFVEIRQNEHEDYKEEKLYIFGKDVELVERFGSDKINVPLYIKLNKVEETVVIVVSFHEQRWPLTYCFK